MVELELPHPVPLKEQEKERPRETPLAAALIEPELAVDDLDNKLAIQHFAFGVTNNDFQLAVDTLQVSGIEFEGPEDTGIAFSLFLSDPDHHTVEITSYHEPVPPDPGDT
jgi:catechol 2,3-dioxygenase-like lactoylglutathione lyase family enzyme